MRNAPPNHCQSDREKRTNEVFMLDKYSEAVFQGIMPDTGAAEKSTAGMRQFQALQRQLPTISLNRDRAGEARIRFGSGDPLESVGTTIVSTPIGQITFHVVETPTPFLLCLKDMDDLSTELHNVRNELVRADGVRVPVCRKWGHAWFYPDGIGTSTDGVDELARAVFLTETELRRVHRRFGHPSVGKMYKFLTGAGYEVEMSALELINRFCHFCQKHRSAPKRFKFTLHKEADFNHEILVDVAYFSGKPVLHVICASTGFQAGSFLKDMTAETTWNTLKRCWMDTYLGPPDILTTDSGTNFASDHFKAEAKLAGITCQQVPVEAHHSIGKIERAHKSLRRAYDIILEEGGGSTEEALQAALSAVNATTGPDGLVPTLLVFGAYPRISMDSPPSASQLQRERAYKKALMELRKTSTEKRIREAINTRNGPNVDETLPQTLALGSLVLVWRESPRQWQGPFRVLRVSEKDITVDTINGPATFRTTAIRPYNMLGEQQTAPEEIGTSIPFEYPEPPPQRKRGRPSTKAKRAEQSHPNTVTKRITRSSTFAGAAAFVTEKERKSYEQALKLRAEGAIKTAGAPFELSDQAEIQSLMAAGVLEAIPLTKDLKGVRIFGCRLVREVKGQGTTKPYEKSRLVAQGHSDDEKQMLLTQAPTILRCSQRLILALVPTMVSKGFEVMLRDITQAYTQSKSDLQRTVLLRLPRELRSQYPENTVLKVIKPLYGLAEAGLHWFATYSEHHRQQLDMEISGYDPCLLITKPGKPFGLVGLQTDDTLNIGSSDFLQKEETELAKAGFKAKPRSLLTPGTEGDFNGCRMSLSEDSIAIRQKGQAKRLELVNHDSESAVKQFIEQRARGAYIASICQPEAAFDFAAAAQELQPTRPEIDAINKRIQWQIDNSTRGLRYVRIELERARLYVFVDGSFANNKDLSSQIGYVIVLGNESAQEQLNGFEVIGNVIHWSSTKCKRITRSVLASEIYGMTAGFDIGYVLNHTLGTIAQRLGLRAPELVICTDSRSLYQCLVQLGSTVEKRLMIDLMAVRQSYEAREIAEIRWIDGRDNPADAMTKALPNKALETLISTNKAVFRVEGWVQRAKDHTNTVPRV